MKALELAIPPPLVMLVVGLIMWLLSVTFPSLAFHPAGQIWAAVVVALAGFGIATAGIIAFRRANTTFDPRNPAGTSALVTAGIYRLTRNPMYLGVLLILIGWGLFLGNILALICAFIFVPYIGRYQIQPEERLLEGKFGAAFTAYKAEVRRWI
jgi:protein-S-isoprenylcysteine O-methyltransferase Ste14